VQLSGRPPIEISVDGRALVNREQFDHAIRAAAAVAGVQEVIVIGSQAAHGFVAGDLPDAAMRSVEADIVIPGDKDAVMADLVDGSIGEASMFHETFGFYAQGVSIDTAMLPQGWEDRLLRYETPATNGVVAWCLSPEDLWVSKALAGRPKDLEFCRSLISLDAVDIELTGTLLEAVEANTVKKDLARGLLSTDS
jgi:hypothetical protein